MTYASFQSQNVSEKIVLCRVKAATRLVGFELHSGSVYKLTGFDFTIIEDIFEGDATLLEVATLGLVGLGSYFIDRDYLTLYLAVSDGSNPNGKFLTLRFFEHFATAGVSLPTDLAIGEEVYWRPLVRSTSDFGSELDNEEQLGFAIEGSGTVSFFNDQDYWRDRFELFVWDQQPVEIWSWTRDIEVSEAKLLYKGKIVGKSYSPTAVSFKLKDQLLALRQPMALANIEDIGSAKVPEALLKAKQRRIYGRVAGHLPTNIDQVVETYTLSGTISVTSGSATVTGSGTDFLARLSPEDEIVLLIDGEDESFPIKSVASNTSLELTESVDVTLSGQALRIVPATPKRFINRVWLVAGHQSNQPSTTVTSVFSLNKITVASIQDLSPDDDIYVGTLGSGEFVTIESIQGNQLVLKQNLLNTVANGTLITRPCIQNLRWNDKKLQFYRDYTISFTGNRTTLTLSDEFEKNLRSVRSLNGNLTFTTGSRTVTGSGTQFTKQLEPGGWVRSVGQFDFFEVLSIESDTSLTLRTNASYTESDGGQYLGGRNFDPEIDFLSCEVTGTTATGVSTGALLSTASEVVQDILETAGVTGLNQPAFDKARDVAPYMIGLVIPKVFTDQNSKPLRDIINEINVSVFGSLVQNEDLELEYNILRPNKPPDSLVLRENDILSFSIESNNDRVAKKAIVNYRRREFDFESRLSSVPLIEEKTSDLGQFLVKSIQEKVIDTVLFYEDDARILVNRWAFLLELGTNVIKVETKLQATRLQVNDIVKIEHEKLFDRVGGGAVKYAAVQGIKKNGLKVTLELDDLSNMFNRVAIIAESGSPDWASSDDEQRAKHGFITDSYGMIDNDPSTHNLNLIW